MAENYKVEVDIDIDGVDDAEEKFLALGKSIDKAKQELDEMRDSNKQGSKAFKQQKKELEDMEQSFKELNKELKGVDASFEDVYGEIQPLTTALGEAEDRLYQLALAGDKTSQEYQDLMQKVASYRRVQMDTDMAVDAAAGTLSEKMGGALQGAASGFAAVQGVMALMGSESEELEKTLIKVQAAMAIAEGVRGLREGAKAFKAMGMAAKVALGGIRKGIIATGIGAAVVALGFMVAYWEDIVKATKKLLGETDSLNEKYEQGEIILEAQKKTTERKIRLMEAEGATAEEIHKVKLAMIDAEIAQSKVAIERAEKQKQIDIETTKRHRAILEGILTWMFGPVDALIGVYNKIVPASAALPRLSSLIADSVFSIEQASDNADAVIKEANDNLNALLDERKILTATFNKQKIADEKSSRNRAKARRDNLLKIEREIFDKTFALREESEQKEIDLAKETFKREKEDLKIRLRNKEINDKQFNLLANAAYRKLKKDLKDIDDKFREQEVLKRLETLDTDLNIEKTKANKTKDIYAVMYGALNTMAEKNAEKQKKLDKEVMAARLQIAHAGLGAIGDLVNSLAGDNEKSAKRAFNVNKAVGIAQAVISTAEGIMKAFAQTTDFTPTQSMRVANAAVVAVAGAAQIATIAKQKFQPSGGGSGSGQISTPSGGGSGSAPSFNVVGDSGISQLAGLQMQPTQAYVVSGDITTAQSLDRNKIENATI